MGKTLVVGASPKPWRYSNLAIQRLREKGISTEAFGIREGNVAGVKIRLDLKDFTDIHTVSLYINPSRQRQYYEAILQMAPKRVVFNPGTENREFANLLAKNDIDVVEGCTLVMLATGQY